MSIGGKRKIEVLICSSFVGFWSSLTIRLFQSKIGLNSCLASELDSTHNFLLGTGCPDQCDKKHKGQNKSSTIAKTRTPDHLTPEPQGETTTRSTPWTSDADTVSSDPLGLGRKFRLVRPPRGSDADTDSPDPLGLGRKFRLARPLQGSGAKRRSTGSRQGFRRTAPVPAT